MSRPPLSKRDPAVAAVLRRWRALTGGVATPDGRRRTLVACSGGADSTALALALHAAGGLGGLAHVVHDLRPAARALADRDFTRGLAEDLGVAFLERSVAVAGRPGVEAAARRARYAALTEMAGEARCPFVAAAHHADDQFETILMKLARGAGPRGLAGMPARRALAPGVVLVRPCLGVTRAALAALCGRAGVRPCVDETNADRRLARNAVRAVVVPQLESLFPGATRRSEELASRMREMDAAVTSAARGLLVDGGLPSRAVLAAAPRAVAHAALRLAVVRTLGAGGGEDRLAWRTGDRIVTGIRDGVGGARRFPWGNVQIVVTSGEVRIEPRAHSSS